MKKTALLLALCLCLGALCACKGEDSPTDTGVNENGTEVSAAQVELPSTFTPSPDDCLFDSFLLRVRTDGKYGVIDINKNTVIPAEYDLIGDFSESGSAVIMKDGLFGVINYKGEILVEPTYNSALLTFENGLSALKEGRKWFYINESGECAFEGEYSYVTPFNSKGYASVKTDDGYSIINTEGKAAISALSHVEPMSLGEEGAKRDYYMTMSTDGYTIYDDATELVYGPFTSYKESSFLIVENNTAEHITNDYTLIIEKGGKFGFISFPTDGPVILTPKYHSVYSTDNKNVYSVTDTEDGERYYVDAEGNAVDVSESEAVEGNLYPITEKDGKYGANHPDGTEILPPVYDYIGEGYREGFAHLYKLPEELGGIGFHAIKDGKEYLINIKGENVLSPDFSEKIKSIQYPNITFRGIVELDGEPLVEIAYNPSEAATYFGLAKPDGTLVLDPKYAVLYVSSASGKDYLVFSVDRAAYGIMDKNGKILFEAKYQQICPAADDRAFIRKWSYDEYCKYTLIDPAGTEYYSFECNCKAWDYCGNEPVFNEAGHTVIESESSVCIIDTDGTYVIAPKYTDIIKLSNTFVFKSGADGLIYNVKTGEKQAFKTTGFPFKNISYGGSSCAFINANGKFCVYDGEGNIVVSSEHDIDAFEKFGKDFHLTKDRQEGLFGICSKDGSTLIEPIYKSIEYDENLKTFIAKKADGSGYDYFDENAKQITDAAALVFTVDSYADGYSIIMINGKQGVADENKNIIIPAEYQSILPSVSNITLE